MKTRSAGIRAWKFGAAALVLGSALGSFGCGDANRASVTGKVTANGAPVTAGTIGFTPVGGGAVPAMIPVQSDGTYDLSGDGVPIGKNNVSYMAPNPEYPPGSEPKPGDVPTPSPFEGMKPTVTEIEIKAGSQTIDVELTKP